MLSRFIHHAFIKINGIYSFLFPKGKIPNLLPDNSIKKETRLLLVNAMYFKGRWNIPFQKTRTKEMPFKTSQVGRLSKTLLSLMKNYMENFSFLKA